MNNYRLTVHVENQPKVDTKPSLPNKRKGVQKTAIDMAREEAMKNREANKNKQVNKGTLQDNKGRYKVYNTLSFYCKSEQDCMKKLQEVRSKYEVAKGNNSKKPEKYGKELYNISFVN
ncbi:MAG: hypothetical protein H8E55_64270 [Pelagibacterales bacterium]|nr:hypothetical protein [Pelagibacterales bacterium]